MKILVLSHSKPIDLITLNILENNLTDYFANKPLKLDLICFGEKNKLSNSPFFSSAAWHKMFFIDTTRKGIMEILSLRKNVYDLFIGNSFFLRNKLMGRFVKASKKITNTSTKINTKKPKIKDVLDQIKKVLKEIDPKKKRIQILPKVYIDKHNDKSSIISWMLGSETPLLFDDSQEIFMYFKIPNLHKKIFLNLLPDLLKHAINGSHQKSELLIVNEAVYWKKKLSKTLKKDTQKKIRVHFLNELDHHSLLPLIHNAKIIISNDTSLLLFSELLGKKNLFYTPNLKFKFGVLNYFYYTEKKLWKLNKKCLNEINYLFKHQS